jgi:uncharacterized Zn finger protein (UPF0148 family)
MSEDDKDQGAVFRLVCPCCQTVIWVDAAGRSIARTEKGEKKKSSLDDLLDKEKKRKEESDRKFEVTAELTRKKHDLAEELFQKALSTAGEGEDEGGTGEGR